MIVSEQDALNRLSSPLNLMNRLTGAKRRDAMGLFGVNNSNKDNNNNNDISKLPIRTSFSNPFKKEETAALSHINPSTLLPVASENPESKEPELDDLVNNADSQVKLGLAHDKALEVLVDSVKMMKLKLDDIKPEKLPAVISATSKVVDQIQRQRLEANKERGTRSVHFHFYTPTQRKVEEYQIVDVG